MPFVLLELNYYYQTFFEDSYYNIQDMWQGDFQKRTHLYSFVTAFRVEAKQLWRNLESLKLGALACGLFEGPNC